MHSGILNINRKQLYCCVLATAEHKKAREQEVYRGKKTDEVTDDGNVCLTGAKRLCKALSILVRNPTYVFIGIAAAMEGW